MTEDVRALAARLLAASRYAMPSEEARAHIAARRRQLLAAPEVPEPDFSPEPLPIVDAPEAFADAFWQSRKQSDKPPRALGRPHLRVIDGDGDKEP
jgi:hypothetical protein